MKSYDRIADSILEKYNSRLEAEKRRKAMILRISAGCAGLCAAAVIGFGVYSGTHMNGNINDFGNSNTVSDITTEADNSTVTTTAAGSGKAYSAVTHTVTTASGKTIVTGSSAVTVYSSNKTSSVSKTEQSAKASKNTVTTSLTTTVITEIPVYERSIYMKKKPTLLAAIITASSVSPVGLRAEAGQLPIPSITPPTRFEAESDEYQNVLNIVNGDFDTDLNSDGKFDIFDVYALYRSVYNAGASDEMRDKCLKNADYNSDGIVDTCDSSALMYYFGLYNEIKGEYFDPDFYRSNCQDKYSDKNKFSEFMKGYCEKVNAEAALRKETMEFFDEEDYFAHRSVSFREIADDIGVLKNYDEAAYSRSEMSYSTGSWDSFPYYRDAGEYENMEKLFTDNMRDEFYTLRWNYPEFKKHCDNGEIDLDVNGDGEYDIEDFYDITVYVQNHNDYWLWQESGHDEPTDHHYLATALDQDTEKRCDSIISGYEKVFHEKPLAVSDKYDETFYFYCFSYFLESNEYSEDYANGSFYNKFSADSSYYNTASIVDRYAKLVKPEENGPAFIDAVFRKAFIAYQKGIEEGSCSEPDINMDGVFDKKDYICINLYLEYSYNGTYSTVYGITLTDDIINNIETNCDYSKNGKSGDLYDIMIVECYSMLKGKMFPEMTAEDYFEETQKFRSYTAVLDEMNVERNGDANCDGDLDMADTVRIMQSLANPDKYELSALGSFNGDISETGNGITVGDALGVQRKLLGIG